MSSIKQLESDLEKRVEAHNDVKKEINKLKKKTGLQWP